MSVYIENMNKSYIPLKIILCCFVDIWVLKRYNIIRLLLKNHLKNLENRNSKKIAKALKISTDDVRAAVKIIQYLEPKPSLITIDNTIGYADLEVEFILKNTDELMQIYEEVSQKFPNTIKDFAYFRALKFYKYFGFQDSI